MMWIIGGLCVTLFLVVQLCVSGIDFLIQLLAWKQISAFNKKSNYSFIMRDLVDMKPARLSYTPLK